MGKEKERKGRGGEEKEGKNKGVSAAYKIWIKVLGKINIHYFFQNYSQII